MATTPISDAPASRNTPYIVKDHAGHRFGRLVVIERAPTPSQAKTRHARWLCHCDCGNETVVSGQSMRRGYTRSCGCITREMLAKNSRTHGHHANGGPSPTYKSWISLVQRCTNPKAPNWKNYGGRGVTVCDRWRNSFEAFLADMGERPEKRSIDRINTNGNYEPGNCRWATAKEQVANRRPREQWSAK